MFAVIESIHLLALSVIGGAVLIVDLRLLGFGLRSRPLREVARDAQPWFIASWERDDLDRGSAVRVRAAEKLYYSTPFAIKMTCLVLATIFALTVRRKVTLAGEGRVSPDLDEAGCAGVAGVVVGVGAGGRWMAVFGIIVLRNADCGNADCGMRIGNVD